MADNNLLKRLLDAGSQFTGMSQEQAEKLVKEFVKVGEARRKDTEKLVQRFIERGRDATEHLVAAVQSEVSKQLGLFASRLDDVEDRIEDLAERLGIASLATKAAARVPNATATPAQKAPAKKAAAKKAPAKKKAAAKKTAAKKTAAKKTAAKKTAKKKTAKKSPAKKASSS